MPHDLGFRGAASRALTDASPPSLQAPHGNRRATLGTAFCARHALSRVHRGGPGRHQGPRGESQAREEVRLVGRWSRARRSDAGSGSSAQGPHCCPPATHTPRPALIPGAGLDCPPLSAVGTGPSLSQRRPSAFPTLRPHVKAPPGPRAREVSPATRGRARPPDARGLGPSRLGVTSFHPPGSGEGRALVPIPAEPSGDAEGGPCSREGHGQLLPGTCSGTSGWWGGGWTHWTNPTATRLNPEKGSFAQETADRHLALSDPQEL